MKTFKRSTYSIYKLIFFLQSLFIDLLAFLVIEPLRDYDISPLTHVIVVARIVLFWGKLFLPVVVKYILTNV